MPDRAAHVVIVGGGHNALVAATYLARAGLQVEVLERLAHVGGAAISAMTFEDHDARLSRYSYLVSLMPEELIADLGLDLELRSRDTASYTPVDDSGLLVETQAGPATRASFHELTGSDAEFGQWQRFYAEVATLADAVSPTLLAPLPRRSEVAARVDATIWTDIVEHPLAVAIERRFAHDVVRGVVGTDALIGTFASLHDPTLVQNRCFLYHLIGNGTGEWRVPVGGMGAVTGELERVAREAGAVIHTDTLVTRIEAHDDRVVVQGQSGAAGSAAESFAIETDWVLSGVAPYVLDLMRDRVPPRKPSGSQLKVNLLLSRLPRLRSGIDPEIAFAGTLHVGESLTELETAWRQASAGTIPAHAAGELYCHTLTDRSILGPELAASGAHTLTYFGLHTPDEVLPDDEATRVALDRMLDALQEHLAEPLEPLILGIEAKSPRDIEAALDMPGGHIFHGDLQWPWLGDFEPATLPAQRWGVDTDHPRIMVCGSGSRRGGAVSGLGGHHAAHALLEFLDAQQR